MVWLLSVVVWVLQQGVQGDELIPVVEAVLRLSGPGVVVLVGILVMRGDLITKKDLQAREAAHAERVKVMEKAYAELVREKDENLSRSEADKAWWRNVATEALEIGETLARAGD